METEDLGICTHGDYYHYREAYRKWIQNPPCKEPATKLLEYLGTALCYDHSRQIQTLYTKEKSQ